MQRFEHYLLEGSWEELVTPGSLAPWERKGWEVAGICQAPAREPGDVTYYIMLKRPAPQTPTP